MKTRAAILYTPALPQPYAQSLPLKIEDLTLAPPGPNELLIQLHAAGICHSDLSVIDNSRPRILPMVLGHEASGIVRELGPNVSNFQPGDHVVFSYVPACGKCTPCITGRASLCEAGAKANAAGTLLSGQAPFTNSKGEKIHHHLGVSAFSQFTVAAEQSLVKIEKNFPLDQAALFGCAILTGVGAVVNTAKVEPGASVAIFGLGGVGLSAVMGAKAAGACPILAIDRFQQKLDLAKTLGATHTLLASGSTPNEIRDLTSGGAQYTFDTTGHPTALQHAYQSTRRGGSTIAIALPHPQQTLNIPAAQLVAEERTLKGSYMGSCIPTRDVPRFMQMNLAGNLPVHHLHSHTLHLEQINEAMDRLAQSQAVRQLILFT
jgi:alcohol dehydrogenase